MSRPCNLDFVLLAVQQGYELALRLANIAGAYLGGLDSSLKTVLPSYRYHGGDDHNNKNLTKRYREFISDPESPKPNVETQTVTNPLHEEREYTPDISYLTHANVGRQRVPALALTSPVYKSLTKLAVGVRKFDTLVPISKERLSKLSNDIKDINDSLGNTFPGRKVELNESDEVAALRLQRWKKIDEARAMATFNKVYGDEEYLDPASDFDANVWDKLKRAGVVKGGEELEAAEHFEELFRKHLREQSTLPWPESDSEAQPPSTEYTESELEEGSEPDVLYRNLEKARARVRAGRASALGKEAAGVVFKKAFQTINGGYVFPPRCVIEQYALLQRTHSLMQFDDALKKYRRLKRRMRKKGLKFDRAFSDDTELSWDGKDGGGCSDEAGTVLYSKRRARRWWEKLPEQMDPGDKSDRHIRPSTTQSFALPSLGFGSGGLSMMEMFDHKYQKTTTMWSKLERVSTRDMFKGRLRTEEPSRKVRLNRRKLNDFLVQMPEHFRYTNFDSQASKPQATIAGPD